MAKEDVYYYDVKPIPMIISDYLVDIVDGIKDFTAASEKCPHKKNGDCHHPESDVQRALGCIWEDCPALKGVLDD